MYTACTAEPRPAARRSHAAHSVRYDPCKKCPRGQSVRSTPHRRLIRNQLRQNGARHVCRGTVFHGALLSAAQLYIIIYSLHCEAPSCGLTHTQLPRAARHSNGLTGNAERLTGVPQAGGTPTNAYGKSANGVPARCGPFEAKSLSIGKACRSRPPFGKQLLEPPPAAGRRCGQSSDTSIRSAQAPERKPRREQGSLPKLSANTARSQTAEPPRRRHPAAPDGWHT